MIRVLCILILIFLFGMLFWSTTLIQKDLAQLRKELQDVKREVLNK